MGRISKAELEKQKRKFIEKYIPYQLTYYSEFDFSILEKTILYYKKAAELEPSPKYTDNWISIAHINQILGNPNEAIQAYQKVLFILKDDYHLTEGYEVDRIKNEISKLR